MKRPLFTALTGFVLGEMLLILAGSLGIMVVLGLFFLLLIICFFGKNKAVFSSLRAGLPLLILLSCSLFCGALLFFVDRYPAHRETGAGTETIRSRVFGTNGKRGYGTDQSKDYNSNQNKTRSSLQGIVRDVRIKKTGNCQIILSDVRETLPAGKGSEDTLSSRTGQQGERAEKLPGKVQLFLTGPKEGEILPGDRLMVRGSRIPLTAPRNPGEFDSRIWCLARGIRLQFMGDSWRLAARPALSVRRAAWQLKIRIRDFYRKVLSESEASQLEAMALGDKSDLDPEKKELYNQYGLAHLLAVSGLHVSILGGSLFSLMRKRKAGYLLSCLTGSLVLLFYGIMTGFESSCARAVIMYLVYLAAQYLGADYDIISAMSLSGILLLADHPYRLLEGGFQLSFASILAIGFVLPLARKAANNQKEPKENRKEKMLPQTGSNRIITSIRNNRIITSIRSNRIITPIRSNRIITPIKRKEEGRTSGKIRKEELWVKAGEKVREGIFAGLVISGVTGPLLMHLFYQWTPAAILLNLVFLPCMEPLMLSALCGGLAGVFLEPAGAVLILPAKAILLFFDRIFLLSGHFLPAAVVTGCPGLLQMLLLYLAEVILFFIIFRPGRVRKLLVLLTLALFGLEEGAGSVALMTSTDSLLKVDLLDVGQGECILIRTPDRKAILIDGGSTSKKKVGTYVILPALKYYGVKKLDFIVTTHMDEDHISGICELLESGYPMGCILMPDAATQDPAWNQFYENAKKCGVVTKRISRGDQLHLGLTRLVCLHPPKGLEPEDRNDSSVVLELSYRQFGMLCTGDLGEEGEKYLVESFKEKAADVPARTLPDVLKVAHHGSRFSTGPEFLSLFPALKTAVISAGLHNRYGHPHRELLDRLKDRGITVYDTPEEGAIALRCDGKSYRISGFRPSPSPH